MRMPAVAVVAHVLPIAIVIEIVDPRNVIADVVVTVIESLRLVRVRIFEVSVVIAIAAIVTLRISSPIVVVDVSARLVWFYPRHHCRRVSLTRHRKRFAFLNVSRPVLSDDLSCAAECGRGRVAVLIDRDLIETRLLKIDGATRRRYFEQATRWNRSHVEQR